MGQSPTETPHPTSFGVLQHLRNPPLDHRKPLRSWQGLLGPQGAEDAVGLACIPSTTTEFSYGAKPPLKSPIPHPLGSFRTSETPLQTTGSPSEAGRVSQAHKELPIMELLRMLWGWTASHPPPGCPTEVSYGANRSSRSSLKAP